MTLAGLYMGSWSASTKNIHIRLSRIFPQVAGATFVLIFPAIEYDVLVLYDQLASNERCCFERRY